MDKMLVADLIESIEPYLTPDEFLVALATKAAEWEREQCYALRQTLPNPYKHCQISSHAYDTAMVDYGKAIRARGEK